MLSVGEANPPLRQEVADSPITLLFPSIASESTSVNLTALRLIG